MACLSATLFLISSAVAARIDNGRFPSGETTEQIAVDLQLADNQRIEEIWFIFVHSGAHDMSRGILESTRIWPHR